jgi:hypothetical protein
MKEDRGPSPPLGREESTYLLARQASMLAHDFAMNAQFDLDGIFGAGFAKRHPEVIGAYMQTAALNFTAGLLADKIEDLHESLRSDHPLQGETFASIAAALECIAEKLGATERAT